MPHTSHKKKKQHRQQLLLSRNKRGEVESDDGWTRIARSDKAFSIHSGNQEEHIQNRLIPPDDPNYDKDLDEGLTQMRYVTRLPEPPKGASLEKALSQYQKCETAFKQSNTWKELKKTFDSRISKQNLNITHCICFGLCTPTGILSNGYDRRNVSLYQIAAFRSILDFLTEHQSQVPSAFAQEPLFNSLDIALLSHLNITVLNHPDAFHLINPNTFTFCPGAEQFVIRGALSRRPAMHMGSGPLATFLDPETGAVRSPDIGTTFLDGSTEGRDQNAADSESPDNPHLTDEQRQWEEEWFGQWREETKEKAELDAVRGAEILHRFKQGKEAVRLPDFDDHEYSLYDTYLFWTVADVKGEEED